MNKVCRDGKVAVLYSPSFGAGWFTWNTQCRALLFDPELVAAVEAENKSAVIARATVLCPDGFFGAADDGLVIEWLDEGTAFRVDEYDGKESLILQGEDDWVVC